MIGLWFPSGADDVWAQSYPEKGSRFIHEASELEFCDVAAGSRRMFP